MITVHAVAGAASVEALKGKGIHFSSLFSHLSVSFIYSFPSLGVAVLLVAEMSSGTHSFTSPACRLIHSFLPFLLPPFSTKRFVEGTLATGDYTQAVLQIGEKHKDTVIGFITQKRHDADPSLLFCTPGIPHPTPPFSS